jgi:hypothetical protein
MSDEIAGASEDQKKLAGVLAPLVADALRPAIRREMWQAAIVCSIAVGIVGYFAVVAKLIDQKPMNQTNTLNVERSATQEDLQREILQQQGHIKGDSR